MVRMNRVKLFAALLILLIRSNYGDVPVIPVQSGERRKLQPESTTANCIR